MNIASQLRQVTDYTFTISLPELERYLADPASWAADVRMQLALATAAADGATPRQGGG